MINFIIYRIQEVQLSDMGSYQCAAKSDLEDSLSIEGHIQLEGMKYSCLYY